jgi:hypothetical protein
MTDIELAKQLEALNEEIEKKKDYMMELQANIEVFMEKADIKNMVIDGIEVSRNGSTEK